MVQFAFVVSLLAFVYYIIRMVFEWVTENLAWLVLGGIILVILFIFISSSQKALEAKKLVKKQEREQWEREQLKLEQDEKKALEQCEREQRLQDLMNKYNDANVIEKIVNGEIWLGQTEKQLLDSLGQPEDTEQKISLKKTVEIWKYHPGVRSGTFKLRIHITNGFITKIDDKT